jgi:hypothetical protein
LELRADVGLRRAEAELLLELALHRHLGHRLDAERDLQVGSRPRGADVGAEALYNTHLVGLHLVVGGEQEQQGGDSDGHRPHSPGRDLRQ